MIDQKKCEGAVRTFLGWLSHMHILKSWNLCPNFFLPTMATKNWLEIPWTNIDKILARTVKEMWVGWAKSHCQSHSQPNLSQNIILLQKKLLHKFGHQLTYIYPKNNSGVQWPKSPKFVGREYKETPFSFFAGIQGKVVATKKFCRHLKLQRAMYTRTRVCITVYR